MVASVVAGSGVLRLVFKLQEERVFLEVRILGCKGSAASLIRVSEKARRGAREREGREAI